MKSSSYFIGRNIKIIKESFKAFELPQINKRPGFSLINPNISQMFVSSEVYKRKFAHKFFVSFSRARTLSIFKRMTRTCISYSSLREKFCYSCIALQCEMLKYVSHSNKNVIVCIIAWHDNAR